uniref:Uncharacterized protein n=1 Tax=Oryza sativa subsp. japonica TaxID=39947 RepID=Q69SV1_ORYSJ|nr:hypothetical protein [Oryza sativa Japonica Group]
MARQVARAVVALVLRIEHKHNLRGGAWRRLILAIQDDVELLLLSLLLVLVGGIPGPHLQ